jgi:hypothetical protein
MRMMPAVGLHVTLIPCACTMDKDGGRKAVHRMMRYLYRVKPVLAQAKNVNLPTFVPILSITAGTSVF